eukprot:31152-Pelagococcus_subviridis.AAC.6
MELKGNIAVCRDRTRGVMGAETRRERKSSRNGVHHANAVVWGRVVLGAVERHANRRPGRPEEQLAVDHRVLIRRAVARDAKHLVRLRVLDEEEVTVGELEKLDGLRREIRLRVADHYPVLSLGRRLPEASLQARGHAGAALWRAAGAVERRRLVRGGRGALLLFLLRRRLVVLAVDDSAEHPLAAARDDAVARARGGGVGVGARRHRHRHRGGGAARERREGDDGRAARAPARRRAMRGADRAMMTRRRRGRRARGAVDARRGRRARGGGRARRRRHHHLDDDEVAGTGRGSGRRRRATRARFRI